MQVSALRRSAVALCATALLATPPSLKAQSTFDGDLTGQGRSQVAVDFLSYVARAGAGGWVWFNPRVYHGLAHDVELGAGYSGCSSQSNGGPSALQPSIKWRAFADTVHHLSMSVGGQSLVAVQQGIDSYSLTFASIDKGLNHSAHAAGAVAVGSYALIGREVGNGDDRHGAIVSAWESIGALRFSGSWLTGHNFYGYKTGSATYTTASSRWFTVGYSVGNAAFHNAGPFFSTGRAF